MDFFTKIFHNSDMELQDYLTLISTTFEIEMVEKTSESSYTFEYDGRMFKLYQADKQIVLEGSIGSPLHDNTDTNLMLSRLLQFNLKRTQFLSNIMFLDAEKQQLLLREILSKYGHSTELLREHLEDFMLNIKVMEDRFFPRTVAH